VQRRREPQIWLEFDRRERLRQSVGTGTGISTIFSRYSDAISVARGDGS
jgi:hypothetical protein